MTDCVCGGGTWRQTTSQSRCVLGSTRGVIHVGSLKGFITTHNNTIDIEELSLRPQNVSCYLTVYGVLYLPRSVYLWFLCMLPFPLICNMHYNITIKYIFLFFRIWQKHDYWNINKPSSPSWWVSLILLTALWRLQSPSFLVELSLKNSV